ncbi:MAG: YveK family protein [Christensenellales bacterium]
MQQQPETQELRHSWAGRPDEGGEDEIDLVELMYRLLEKWKIIVSACILGALIAGVYTICFVTPMYTATSKLYVVNAKDSAINLSDLQVGNYLASDYTEVFSNWHVHEMVLERLGLDYTYSQLSNMVSVTNPQDTRILYVAVQSSDPQEAKDLADTAGCP